MWQMEWGDKLDFLLGMEERTGKPPDALLRMPKIDEVTSWYLDAFYMLSSSRQMGMSIGPIPLSEITNYGIVFDTVDDLNTFCIVIASMDSAYLKHVNKQKGQSK